MPRTAQISRASVGWALPVNTFRLFMSPALMPFCPALRSRLRPVVGAGGFEPPVLDPKSSVLPLYDAPTVGSRWLPVLRRCGIVRVESSGPLAVGRLFRTVVGLPDRGGCSGAALREDLSVLGQHLVLDLPASRYSGGGQRPGTCRSSASCWASR